MKEVSAVPLLEPVPNRSKPSPREIEDFFVSACQSFDAAACSTSLRRELNLAGHSAELLIADPDCLSLLTRALSVPIAAPGIPNQATKGPTTKRSLTLRIWDSASSGIPPLTPPWRSADFSPFGEIRGCTSGRFLAAFEADAGALSMFDTQELSAFYWCRDISRLPAYVIATPLRSILQWWMRANGLELIHSAAVGTEKGAVLIVGAGGAGKSNAALSCVKAGLDYLGDDYCLVSVNSNPRVYSAYGSAKLFPADCGYFESFFPLTEASTPASGHEKRICFLGRHAPKRMLPSAPLQAIILMSAGSGAQTRTLPCSETAIFLAIAENTSALLQFGTGTSFSRIAQLVRAVPRVHVERGADARENIVSVIEDILYKYTESTPGETQS